MRIRLLILLILIRFTVVMVVMPMIVTVMMVMPIMLVKVHVRLAATRFFAIIGMHMPAAEHKILQSKKCYREMGD